MHRTDSPPSEGRSRLPVIAIYILVPVVLGTLMGLMVESGAWYDELDKSPLNPPSWVFGPVWTVLYALMGLAGYFAWSSPSSRLFRTAMLLWAGQLLLNLAWTPIFFNSESPSLALAEISLLVVMLIATVVVFAYRSMIAALLMLPYLAWVMFAGYLNLYIVLNN